MKRTKIIRVTLATMFLVSLVLTRPVQANKGLPTPQPPPDEQQDWRNGEQCNVPGIVVNSSDITFIITGDIKENGRLVWKQFNLRPGQRSTIYLCDTDYIAHLNLHWDYSSVLVIPRQWSPYLFNSTRTCRNHTVNGNSSFRCTFTKWNWGKQD
jgi:hypothetical protein